ncbi:MAG: hypothetical protein K6G92_03955 [Bacteroidaceae bacterium]|nr:hypothetical protein [Bacteroidaceae bacterium]
MKKKLSFLQQKYLNQHFSDLSDAELAAKTGASKRQIRYYAFLNSLKKSNKRKSEARRHQSVFKQQATGNMETIRNKVLFLRDALKFGEHVGVLESPAECCSMAATICRFNKRESKPLGVTLSQHIDYATGVVKVQVRQLSQIT